MSSSTLQSSNSRLTSLDAFRGFIMACMISAGLGFAEVAQNLSDEGNPSALFDFLSRQFSHVSWIGCSFWDLIQPSFIFIVGVAMPYSLNKRAASGATKSSLFKQASKRSLILILLGIFLTFDLIQSQPDFDWHLYNVLTQIGLAYICVFGLVRKSLKVQLISFFSILTGYWLLFALWPILTPELHYTTEGLSEKWILGEGFFRHWEMNANVGSQFDVYFLNLWPRPQEFAFSKGGYTTLNFIPSMATMLMGIIIGCYLQKAKPVMKTVFVLAAIGIICILSGYALGQFAVPLVKRLWTPSWTLFSGGWVILGLSFFFLVADVYKIRGWEKPFISIGRNPISIYMLSMLFSDPAAYVFSKIIPIHSPYLPILFFSIIVIGLWFIAHLMDRRKIHLRI